MHFYKATLKTHFSKCLLIDCKLNIKFKKLFFYRFLFDDNQSHGKIVFNYNPPDIKLVDFYNIPKNQSNTSVLLSSSVAINKKSSKIDEILASRLVMTSRLVSEPNIGPPGYLCGNMPLLKTEKTSKFDALSKLKSMKSANSKDIAFKGETSAIFSPEEFYVQSATDHIKKTVTERCNEAGEQQPKLKEVQPNVLCLIYIQSVNHNGW